MKLLTAKANHPNKKVFSLENLVYAKRSGQPLQDILDGNDMLNPIEVKKHIVSDTPRIGANGLPYQEKEFSVWRGSQRVKAAIIAGYTHIEGIMVDEITESQRLQDELEPIL